MRDPKAIRKAIMTAKSIASLVDPKFARIPLPDLGVSAPEVYVPEHSPAMHEAYGLPMPEHYAGGGNVYGDNSKIRVVGSHEGEHRLVPISPKNTNYRHVMEYVPIKWLLERRGNEYRHSPERMAQLRREIEEEGLREPVLISVGKNSRTAITGEGNHRVLAAHQLGYTHIPVRAMVGDSAGSDVFPEGTHDEDIIPKPNKYFPSEAKPSRVMRSLGYEGQEELPERWWDEGYAAGGEVEDQNPFAQPNDLGFYSHAAATAAGLPQERGTPEQFRGMLLNKGVKPAELEWSGFDEAFADQPMVTRQQVAEHFHEKRPPVQEKRFQELPSVNELNALRRKHLDEVGGYQQRAREEANFDPDGELWKRLQYWHQAEKRELLSKYDRPHHENYTIPGGENYREILLKHGGEEGFKGVPVHFKGEPNVLTSLMVKDREDAEGDKVLHLDELQSDWAQKGRKEGFESKASQDYKKYVHDLTERFFDNAPKYFAEQGYDDDEIGRALRQYHSDPASMAAVLGESDRHKELVLRDHAEPNGPHGRAPYVTKTEDWVDLGLKRALREAAEGGHDKLAWSPGKTIADRYDLAKHVGDIHHEKNDDGTYNLIVRGHDGETILKEDDWKPEKVAEYFGKGVADRILAGEGESGKEAYDRHFAARDRYNNFLDMAADKLADKEVEHLSGDDREIFHKHAKRVYKNGLERQPAELLGEIGLLDDYKDVSWDLQDAEKALQEAPYYSPYRDWRRLSNLDLQVGEKWPFEMYDRMIPKRLLKLAKQHDPEAKLEKSVISHKADHDMYEFYPEDEYGNASDEPANPHPMTQTELHAIRITPKMRESILKKGFPAYAQGGEVEAYADGGAPDDQYTQNPNGGLMFPPEEGAARLETMQRRNALVSSGKKPDAGLPKNPRIVIPAPEGSKLPDFVTGNITFDDWRKRHEKILSDDEIHHSSNWYKNIYGNFLKYYPDPQEAKKMMRAWLVAQQNVSPAGAMNNVLMQQEQMERGDPEHLWRAGGMPNPTAAARAVLSGQPISGGVGQKISDFVDSAEGKSTRSWMGDHPHGGDPFVVDVHTARDTGMIDQELINHLKRVGYNPEQLDKLQIDLKGTPTEAAYENRAQFGRDLTAYLNKINWKGRNDWTPAEVQAVGWMGMTKLTRNAEEDSESGLGRNLRRISYELSPGEGSPWSDKYGEAFENLPDEDRYAITQKMADSAMEHAKKLSGINVHSLVHGTGAWENYQNPAAVAQSLSTQRAADIAAAALGHMLQQTEVWHNRIKPIGASPKGFALDFIERGSKNLADPGALREFWQKVMNADPHGIVKGYQPITLPSGEVGLRALFDKGGAKAQKAIEDLFAPHKVDKEGNIVQKNPFRTMLEDHPFDLDIMGHEAEITKHRNDWKEQKNGEGYLSRLVDLLGYDPSATLNSARKQLEKEFEQHLDEAHKRKGTTWRKAYGGALKAAPVVGAAMKYLSVNSHHDPSSKMRFARSAMMIAKSTKKK